MIRRLAACMLLVTVAAVTAPRNVEAQSGCFLGQCQSWNGGGQIAQSLDFTRLLSGFEWSDLRYYDLKRQDRRRLESFLKDRKKRMSVPEPGSALLLLSGVAAIGYMSRKRRGSGLTD